MRDEEASFTARWVAACRGLSGLLPPAHRLIDDPLGLAFGGRAARAIAGLGRLAPRTAARLVPHAGPLSHTLVWLQIRSRAIDDAVRAFVEAGGRQIVLLGAGFDARAVRLHHVLGGATVFEVDHPATQRAKQRELARALAEAPRPSAPVRYVAWDFEKEALSDLPDALVRAGLDRDARVLTIWEGVTMYLTPSAIDESVRAIARFGAAGSVLAMTYFDVAFVRSPSRGVRIMSAAVARLGEPWRFGWDPAALPAWLEARGFALEKDDVDVDLVRRWMSPRYLGAFEGRGHVAVARILDRDQPRS
jgi:methyltransferase (TIGR00027 family)